MNFDPSEEQVLLAETAERLFAREGQDAAARWRACLDLGLAALPFAEEQGGLGGGHEEVMLVMEAIGRHLADVPWWQSVLLAGRVLALAGGETADAALARLLERGERHALCLFEPDARYRWSAPATTATRERTGWRLTGAKLAVLDASEDCTLIVSARSENGLGLFVVPPGSEGVALEYRPTPDGRRAANVELDGVDLPEAAAIGDPTRNEALLAEVIDGAALASCAESIGAMERLLAMTVDYLNLRQQFGVTIGTFQALQHRAADMLIAIERARSITIYAASAMDGPSAARTVAVASARALVNRSSRFVGQQAIQLHGGMGLAAETPAGGYFQRLTVLETILGDTDHYLAIAERGADRLLDP